MSKSRKVKTQMCHFSVTEQYNFILRPLNDSLSTETRKMSKISKSLTKDTVSVSNSNQTKMFEHDLKQRHVIRFSGIVSLHFNRSTNITLAYYSQDREQICSSEKSKHVASSNPKK